MPFAGFRDFADCVQQNKDKRNPDAYCGSIKHNVEDKAMRKAKQRLVRRPEDLLGAVRKALTAVSGDPVDSIVKALSGPVAEAGDKKPTPAVEGAQDDQAFAVAHGPDNYDALTKKAQALAYLPIFKAVDGVIAKQGMAAMNVPGNLKEHLQKALAAVHGREVFDPRYEQACKLLKKVCDLMDDIEKTAEGAQGGSGAMVMDLGD